MTKCTESDCRNLEMKCIDCGRLMKDYKFPDVSTLEINEYYSGFPWISIKDYLPTDTKYGQENVLVFYDGNCYTAYYNGTSWCEFGTTCGCCADILNPTHWMPLPPTISIENK